MGIDFDCDYGYDYDLDDETKNNVSSHLGNFQASC